MTFASARDAELSGSPSALESILPNDWSVVGAMERRSIGHSYRTRPFGIDMAIELAAGAGSMTPAAHQDRESAK